jgi:hypothetical protein
VADDIEIIVAEVNDIEARVIARYCGTQADTRGGRVTVRGTLRGPFCEKTRTLPAEFAFWPSAQAGEAIAIVPDPCTWSPELPHFYQVDLEAIQNNGVMAAYYGTIGLRRAPNLPHSI